MISFAVKTRGTVMAKPSVIGLVLLLVASANATAQDGGNRLSCDGMISDFARNIRDIESHGGFIELRRNSVKVAAIDGFEGTYAKTASSETQLCFGTTAEPATKGCLNRTTGELSISKQRNVPAQPGASEFERTWTGNCRNS
ncbi:MAG: hypothetical protein NT083_06470 [Rhodocyclales bacterium]|nr:hypothetical protein [Rhodocyclales bacterium]